MYVSILCSPTTKVNTETKCSDMKCFCTDVNLDRKGFKTFPKCTHFIGKWMYMVPSVLPLTFLFPTILLPDNCQHAMGKI